MRGLAGLAPLLILPSLSSACAGPSTLTTTWRSGGEDVETRELVMVEGPGSNSSDGTTVARFASEADSVGTVTLAFNPSPTNYDAQPVTFVDVSSYENLLDGTAALEFSFIGVTGDSAYPLRWEGRFATADADGQVPDEVADGIEGEFSFTNVCDGSVESTFSIGCGLNIGSLVDLPIPVVATFGEGGGLADSEACPAALSERYDGGNTWTWDHGAYDLGNGTSLPCYTTSRVGDASILCGEVRDAGEADGCSWRTSIYASPGSGSSAMIPVGGAFYARSEDCDRQCGSWLKSGD